MKALITTRAAARESTDNRQRARSAQRCHIQKSRGYNLTSAPPNVCRYRS
jgi:hypothetical protein